MSSWMFDGFKRWVFPAESVVYFSSIKAIRRERGTSYHHPLRSARLYRSCRAKVAASDEAEPIDRDCEIADAPASFKSDLWKHFGDIIKKKNLTKNCTMDVLLRYFCAVMFSYCYRPTVEPFGFVVTGQFCHNYICLLN